MMYGTPGHNSVNTKTPWGVVCSNEFNNGIKMVSNSGVVLWEQYIADHPNLVLRDDRFNMTVEATAYAPDQNAIIMLTRNQSLRAGTFFYLIAYDATSGLPIAEAGLDQKVTQYSTSPYNNPYSTSMGLVYNPISQTVYCYSVVQASNAKNLIKPFVFTRSNTANPFRAGSTSTFLKWKIDTYPNNPRSKDFLVDLAVDYDTGLMYGMFQSRDNSDLTKNKAVYVVPFNENFSSIRNATGQFIPDVRELFDGRNDYLYSPNIVYRSDPTVTGSGYWYGIFYSNTSGQQKAYRLTIPLVTDYDPFPSVGTPIVELITTQNNNNRLTFDENKNMLLCGVFDGNQITNYGYVNNETAANLRTFTSSTNWPSWDYNVVLTNEDSDSFKAINSALGVFEQYVDGEHVTSKMTPMPMIPLDYRSQLLNYTSSGSSLYPSQVTDPMLQGLSEGALSSDKASQGAIKGDGLWAVLKNDTSNVLDGAAFKASDIVTNDGAGTIDFNMVMPYTANGQKFENVIDRVHLSGFKTFTRTTITENNVDVNRFNNVPDVAGDSGLMFRERAPNEIDELQIKHILMSLMNQRPVNFTPDNLIIDTSTFKYDYHQGIITIPEVNCNLWYDNNGVLHSGDEITLQTYLKLTGFYQGNETYFDADDNMTAPLNTVAQDYLNPNILYPFLYSWLHNSPVGFNYQTDFQIDLGPKNAVVNGNNGSLTLKQVYLKRWIDKNGELHTDLSAPYKIVINGFIQVPNATWVRKDYAQYLPGTQPTDVSEATIKTILKQISMNLPLNFTEKNISFATAPIFDNLKGTITVEPIYDLTYNDKGIIVTNPTPMGTVVLSGYKAVQPTEPLPDWDIAGYKTFATDLADEKDYIKLKELIASNITWLPFFHETSSQDFDPTTDVIINPDDVHALNTDGSITVTFKLQKYYDKNGIYHDDDAYPATTVTITGFRRIFGPTSFNALYQLGYTSVSPQSIGEPELRKLIMNIGKNLSPKLKEKDIIFKSINSRPSEGLVKFVPILPYYYDDNGNPQSTPKEFPEITVTGFRKVLPTSFDPDRWIFGTSSLVAEKVATNEALLKELLMRKIINPPKNFSTKDIIILAVSSSNRQGSISVSVKLQRYYDVNGNLKNDGKSQIFNLTINGFFVAYSKTDINNMLDINNPWLLPQLISIPQLKEFLMASFTNLPPDFTADNILLKSSGVERSNIEGTITIPHLTINYYFDQTLKLQTSQKTFSNIVIKGFKKSQATIIPNTDWNIGNNDITASEFIKNEDDVKKLIAGRILNLPDNFDPVTDINLSGFDAKNNLGAFKVDVSLLHYYDTNGVLLNSPSVAQEIIISGFKIIDGATSFIEKVNSYQPNTSPSDLSATNVQQILFNTINNPVPGMTASDINVDNFKADNTKGTITVSPVLTSWFDDALSLQTGSKTFPEVTIFGFRQNDETYISDFWEYGDSTITAQEALIKDPSYTNIKEIIANNIINKPSDFNPSTDIIISNTEALNTQGAIKISFTITKYYDAQGILQTSGFPTKTIQITGYNPVSKTIIPSSGWDIGTQNYLASDFVKPEMQNTLKQMIYRRIINLPANYDYASNIILDNLKPDNVKGSLAVSVRVKQGYGDNYGQIDYAGSSANLNSNITITGFYQQTPTIIKAQVSLVNCHDLIPQVISNNKQALVNLIYENRAFIFENNSIPANFSTDDILQVETKDADNKNGKLTVNLKIKNYYQEGNGNLVNDVNVPLTKTVVLSGFDTSKPTVFNNDKPLLIQSLSNEYASSFNATASQWTEKWKTIILNNMNDFMTNLPSDFTAADILNVTVSDINDANGTCSIAVSLKNYFNNDNTCSLQEDPKPITFAISGFKKNNATKFNDSIIIRELNVNSDIVLAQNYLASDIYNNSIAGLTSRDIVEENIYKILNNVPGNFVKANIKGVKNKSFDNLKGQLVVTVTITNYFNDLGVNETTQTLSSDITINGFKKVQPTTWNNEQLIASMGQQLATSLNDDEIKTLIYNYRTLFFGDSLPSCTLDEFKNYFEITNTDKNNSEAKLVVNGKLGIYFNDQGILVKDNNAAKNLTLTITGFKQNDNKTVIRDQVNLDSLKNSLASNEIKDTLSFSNIIISYKDIIFINAPGSLTSNDFSITNLVANNKAGTVSFDLNLFKYYNANGILVESLENPLKQHITIGGFETLTLTSIGSVELSDARNITASVGSSKFLPSYYKSLSIEDAQQQLLYLLESRISKGSINNKLNNALTISDFKFDPNTANDDKNSLVVTFTLTNFITDEGLITTPQSFTLTMYGFGTYKESALSKDTLYYIMVTAVVYLTIVSTAVVAYVIYRGVLWKKGKH